MHQSAEVLNKRKNLLNRLNNLVLSIDQKEKIIKFEKQISGYNWGLDCGGSGIFVVDVENKKGKNGSDTLQELQKIHGNLPLPLR